MPDRSGLDAVISARFTRAEKDAIRDTAREAGMSLSAYARRRLLGHVVTAGTDRATIRELRRTGGLLKLVHIESEGAYSTRTADALDAVRRCIDRIAAGR